jgi:hypothetical protein
LDQSWKAARAQWWDGTRSGTSGPNPGFLGNDKYSRKRMKP